MGTNDFLWVEKYRPLTVQDCILPNGIKDIFSGFLEQRQIPNLLLSGTPGLGKTSIAKALCQELGSDFLLINGSDEGRYLDTVRNTVKPFASTRSITSSSNHKVVIFDEADNTLPDVQLLLRACIEEFQSNCRFIFTCNFKNRIIEPLHSRVSVVDFNITGKNKAVIAEQFLDRCCKILDEEGVSYNIKVIAELIMKFFPDFRRTLNELQRYSSTGTIDTGIMALCTEDSYLKLAEALKSKNFTNVKSWVQQNIDNSPTAIMRGLYDRIYTLLDKSSIATAVLIIAEYQYKDAFVADHEINLLACFTQIMLECNFV
jgi:DNA polymerase III delta prime subunit